MATYCSWYCVVCRRFVSWNCGHTPEQTEVAFDTFMQEWEENKEKLNGKEEV